MLKETAERIEAGDTSLIRDADGTLIDLDQWVDPESIGKSTQIFRVRNLGGRQYRCPECREGIRKGQYVVRLEEHKLAHWACAGVEGKLESCPNCFMITSNCIC